MEKIRKLNIYQKVLLVFMIIMPIVFAVVYSMTISKVGYEYNDTILVSRQENNSTIYEGKIKGQKVQFTVSEEKIIVFEYGDKIYGPYSAKEDPTAIPEDIEELGDMTGIVVYEGEDILFRGGTLENGSFHWLYNEDGTLYNSAYFVDGDGAEIDENGNVIDAKPSVYTILELMNTPKLIHKGEWGAWFTAVLICVVNMITILFVDELFRFNLSFQIRNADNAEPSDLEIVGRYVSWTALAISALIIFIVGLV